MNLSTWQCLNWILSLRTQLANTVFYCTFIAGWLLWCQWTCRLLRKQISAKRKFKWVQRLFSNITQLQDWCNIIIVVFTHLDAPHVTYDVTVCRTPTWYQWAAAPCATAQLRTRSTSCQVTLSTTVPVTRLLMTSPAQRSLALTPLATCTLRWVDII